MSSRHKIVIGTRGSRLALVQTDLAVQALKAKNPLITIETKIIVTKGDKNLAPIPLDTIGKAWFTKEIEDALLSGEIDIAIHSLKDLPPETPAGLRTMPILERDDPRDVLIAKTAPSLADLPKGAAVGTDSLRRKAQLLLNRPDLTVKSVRGNVDTRLQKLQDEPYDAIVLAAAGLKRLGLLNRITQYFSPAECVPAAGQAVLAAEARHDNGKIWELLRSIQDETTQLSCQAEQAFTDVVGGGCKLPVGCYAEITGGKSVVYGTVGTMDAKHAIIQTVRGSKSEVVELAANLAKALLAESAKQGW